MDLSWLIDLIRRSFGCLIVSGMAINIIWCGPLTARFQPTCSRLYRLSFMTRTRRHFWQRIVWSTTTLHASSWYQQLKIKVSRWVFEDVFDLSNDRWVICGIYGIVKLGGRIINPSKQLKLQSDLDEDRDLQNIMLEYVLVIQYMLVSNSIPFQYTNNKQDVSMGNLTNVTFMPLK